MRKSRWPIHVAAIIIALLWFLVCVLISIGVTKKAHASEPLPQRIGVGFLIDSTIVDSYGLAYVNQMVANHVATVNTTYEPQFGVTVVAASIATITGIEGADGYSFLTRASVTNHQGADVMAILTDNPMVYMGQSINGLAFIGHPCDSNAALVERVYFNGYVDSQTLKHELAHTLGVPDDGSGVCKDAPHGFIMNPNVGYVTETFSDCSVAVARENIAKYGACFNTAPAPVDLPVGKKLEFESHGGGALSAWFVLLLIIIAIITMRGITK